MRVLTFVAVGDPAGKGSLRTFPSKHNGKQMGDFAPNVKRFQKVVERAAVKALGEIDQDVVEWVDPIDTAVAVDLEFRFPTVAVRRRQAQADGMIWKAVAPDVDKLARTVLDALQNAHVITNDARVVDLHCRKVECSDEVIEHSWSGVMVRVREMPAYERP